MGKKDSVGKAFFRIPERFADTCNGILFDGRDVISPSELSEIDIEYAFVNGNDNKSGGEFISGIKKDDKFTPVITIVVYLGKEKWDGAVYLHEMLNISDDIKPYVTNHKINLYDYHDYDNFSNFKTDVSLAFEAMSAITDRKRLKNIFSGANGVIAPDTMRFVGTMLDMKNINKYITVNEYGKEEEGHMCKALEDLFEDGRQSRQPEIDKLATELAAAKAEIEKLKALIGKDNS